MPTVRQRREPEPPADGKHSFTVRIPRATKDEIDELRKLRHPVRIPRHTWVMEAIAEKLRREAGKQITPP